MEIQASVQGYRLSFHILKSRNLPKADTLGKIDAYYRVKMSTKNAQGMPINVDLGKTSVKNLDFNPKHDKTFRCKFATWDEMRAAVFDVECWDDDKGRKDEMVATCRVPFPADCRSIVKLEMPLVMAKGFKPYDKSKPSVFIFSMGWVRDKEHLASCISLNNPLVIVQKDRVLNQVGHAFGLEPADVILCAEYEKDEVDIKLWVTKRNCTKVFELAFASSGLKYTCKHRSCKAGELICGYQVFTELKISDVPFHYDFRQLNLTVSDVEPVDETDVDVVVTRHGWKGCLTYKEAKNCLKDAVFNDKKQTIAFCEDKACFLLQYENNDMDYLYGVYEADSAQGVFADIQLKGKQIQTRTMIYFTHPQSIKNNKRDQKISMQVKLDDVKYGVTFDEVALFLYKRVNPVNFPLINYLPCQ